MVAQADRWSETRKVPDTTDHHPPHKDAIYMDNMFIAKLYGVSFATYYYHFFLFLNFRLAFT